MKADFSNLLTTPSVTYTFILHLTTMPYIIVGYCRQMQYECASNT